MGELETTKVTHDTVQRAIMKLEREKSDGELLISDHLILAPTSFTKILHLLLPHYFNMDTLLSALHWCAKKFLMVLNQLYVSRFRETIHAKKTWSI